MHVNLSINQICDIAPVMVCGDKDKPPPLFWGYEIGQLVRLKNGSGGDDSQELSSGNFHLIVTDDQPGGKQAMNALGIFADVAFCAGWKSYWIVKRKRQH